MGGEFWIVAGPNGAGKSTLVQLRPLADVVQLVSFWNPDALALDFLKAQGFVGFADAPAPHQQAAFLRAANIVSIVVADRLKAGQAVGVETVLSTDKYKPFVERVLAEGGQFGLIYVALRSPEIARQRIAQRIREGGHEVPENKVESRFYRSLANLPWFAAKATQFWVFDNSDAVADQSPPLIAYGGMGKLEFLLPEAIPQVTQALNAMPRVSS